MRILQLTDLYRPVIGGMERHVEMLAHELVARGHEVAVVTAAIGEDAGTSVEEGVMVHRVRSTTQRLFGSVFVERARPFHPSVPDPAVAWRLAGLLRAWRPDVVHAHSWMGLSYLPLAGDNSPPVVMTAHDYGLLCAKKTMLRSDRVCSGPRPARCLTCATDHYGVLKGGTLTSGLLASRPLLKRVDRFLAVSAFVARSLGALRDRHGRGVEVLHSFVPDRIAERAGGPRPGWLPAEDGYLLFVGALSAHKGVHVLLDAYRRLPHAPALVLAGTPQFDTPTSLPPGCRVVTNVPHAEVLAAMGRASLLLAPSIWPDPLPMTVSESQLAGTPVVATRTGGIPEMVLDGQTGVLVPAGDAPALSEAIARLLAEPERRLAMAARGQTWAQRFTASAVIDRTEEFYQEAAAAAP